MTSKFSTDSVLARVQKLFDKRQAAQSQIKRTLRSPSAKHRAQHKENGNRSLKLVIFDKDGTLVCFHTMWGPWCEKIANKLCNKTALELTQDVYKLFNYDPATGRIGKGSLAEKTHGLLQADMTEMLIERHAISPERAEKLVMETWDDMTTSYPFIKPVGNVKAVFEALKAANIKIAICTSDDRANTMVALDTLGVTDMADYILCGSDPHNVAKPAPDNVRLICSKLNVDRKAAAVIGDTPADTEMGQSSGAGLVVGVLSGVCDKKELACHADLVLDDIESALPIILNSESLSKNHQCTLF